QALSFSVALILVAVFTKIIGCGLTARITGFSWRQSLQIGVGMIPRAEVALVIASLALARRSISDATFASVVLLVVVTTILTPPLLKWSFKDV
ncbi:MAG TPA: cation:proton antiporter, partial [Firmicutes bacterium]|nr:cation:proton antiporter [Bacillota bacterium]